MDLKKNLVRQGRESRSCIDAGIGFAEAKKKIDFLGVENWNNGILEFVHLRLNKKNEGVPLFHCFIIPFFLLSI
jgi:hypothetical protein